MFTRTLCAVLSLLILAAFYTVGPGAIQGTAYAQWNNSGDDWRSRDDRDRERAREEGYQERKREEQRENSERNRARSYGNSRDHSGADCNVQWSQCATYCNTIHEANQRAACVGNCNSELTRCNQGR